MNTIKTFHQRYTKNSNGCWIWNKVVNKYPKWWYDNKDQYVHRWSYETFVGSIPKGYDICHKCDTPACVNPDHLFAGTRQDNINDMVSKQRQARGEKNNKAKLTEEQVKAIRKDSRKCTILAKEYNVHENTIYDILKQKTWKHI